MNSELVYPLLEDKFRLYNNPGFIISDPIAIPHLFSRKQDIEIAGFLTATIAWGNRKNIISDARRLMLMMDDAPYDFLTGAKDEEYKPFLKFVHRTFNGDDCLFFLQSLRNIYSHAESLEQLFTVTDIREAAIAITGFRDRFLQTPHLKRSEKHIANPFKGKEATFDNQAHISEKPLNSE